MKHSARQWARQETETGDHPSTRESELTQTFEKNSRQLSDKANPEFIYTALWGVFLLTNQNDYMY